MGEPSAVASHAPAQTTDYLLADEMPSPKSLLQRRRPRTHSPASSPHKLGKEGPKRKRTVSTRMLSSAFNRVPVCKNQLPVHPTQQVLRLQDFEESESEEGKRKSMQLKLFSYTLQKYVVHHSDKQSEKQVLRDVRQFLDQAQAGDEQPSQVYYMELVDENPDDDETMARIADDLLEKFSTETPEAWVVLVGDGKTYQHLLNIKRQYGPALHKLLIFPGDWHTLKNFQPVLMKVYYSAGLRELATSSGYRGQTLKSLESCSSFKRTHCFLLHVWEALYREILHAYYMHKDQHGVLESAKCILSSAIEHSLT